MQTARDLQNQLRNIDHKSYPAYKGLRGSYQFEGYELHIDHVQGDPFAAPSHVRIEVPLRDAKFPEWSTKDNLTKTALADELTRQFERQVAHYTFKAKGSGKSGLLSVTRCGQEVLKRTACEIGEKYLIARFSVGFPANGRTINARELEKILFDYLPACVQQSFYFKNLSEERLQKVIALAEDQEAIRSQLKEKHLVAFVADGAILPRESGISSRPMRDSVAFSSPDSLRVSMELPHKGTITGMGIPEGITLIVGGGYHGKSTLLQALELGVYNHIAGDGREYVITDDTAVKLRAEDGRFIKDADISMFINDLPNKKDTHRFSTEDASGSTSQAANTVEAMEAGSTLFLIDEDTSATNFMIRDQLMQRVVNREEEPIIPFIDRVSELYEREGISTILVAGSSGSYFHKADTVIQMKQYLPVEITDFAKKEAEQFPLVLEHIAEAELPSFERIVKRDVAFQKENRIKMKALGKEAVSVNREEVDLRLVEQLTDHEQLEALVQILKYMKLHMFDGKRTLQEAVEELYTAMQKKEFAAFCTGGIPGNLALPRKQEIYAVLNRCRGLLKIE